MLRPVNSLHCKHTRGEHSRISPALFFLNVKQPRQTFLTCGWGSVLLRWAHRQSLPSLPAEERTFFF